MKIKLVLILLLFLVSIPFAVMAFGSPVKSAPIAPKACEVPGAYKIPDARCEVEMAQYQQSVLADQGPIYAHQLDLFMAGSTGAFTAILLAYEGSLHSPALLRRVLRTSILLASSVFALCYLSAVSIDGLSGRNLTPLENALLSRAENWYGSSLFACIALAFFGLALVGFTLYGLQNGAFKAVKDSVRFFAVPGLLFLEVLVLVFDGSEMADHVTNFATWSVGGVYLLSNWNVLFAASFLAILFYLPPLFKKVRRLRSLQARPSRFITEGCSR
jgi:hypothetical protein